MYIKTEWTQLGQLVPRRMALPLPGALFLASGKTQSTPNNISIMAPSTIQVCPPNWTKSRTFVLRFTLAL